MEKDLEKDIKNAVEELNILIIKTKEMLTLLKETFCGDNIYFLLRPNEHKWCVCKISNYAGGLFKNYRRDRQTNGNWVFT